MVEQGCEGAWFCVVVASAAKDERGGEGVARYRARGLDFAGSVCSRYDFKHNLFEVSRRSEGGLKVGLCRDEFCEPDDLVCATPYERVRECPLPCLSSEAGGAALRELELDLHAKLEECGRARHAEVEVGLGV